MMPALQNLTVKFLILQKNSIKIINKMKKFNKMKNNLIYAEMIKVLQYTRVP